MRRVIVFLCLCACYALPLHAQNIPACDPAAPLSNGDPSTSPDGRYTVYFECYAPDQTQYTVFAYDADSGNTLTLGETAPDLATESIFTARWLTDTRAAFRTQTGGGTYNWRSVYIADVTEPGSLTEIARDYVSRPRYGDSPPRYEWAEEDGVSETFTVYRYDVQLDATDVLYEGDCLLRDDLANELSCHMVTPNTNDDFTDDGPTMMILNVGDSAREVKTVEVRALTSGDLLYSVDALGAGYAEWVGADTAAVFNLAFDFETAGFAGVFVRFDDDGAVIDEEPFSLPNGEELTQRPTWLLDDNSEATSE
ncbi:MAG: hypothetical protein AAFU54_11085 [Chloroflexota bacterium]